MCVSRGLQAGAAVVQALTAIVIVWLTCRLVRATNTYARLTEKSLDWEWRPSMHLAIRLDDSSVRLRVFNLAKISVVVTHLFVQIDREEEIKKFNVDLPIPGLKREESEDLTERILETVSLHMTNGSWDGRLLLSVGFLVSGADEPRRSKPVRYHVVVRDRRVVQATRIPPYAAGTPESAFKE